MAFRKYATSLFYTPRHSPHTQKSALYIKDIQLDKTIFALKKKNK